MAVQNLTGKYVLIAGGAGIGCATALAFASQGAHIIVSDINLARLEKVCSEVMVHGVMSAYAASKHAVMGLTDTLALELDGTPIRISAVCPGIINTDITASPHAPAISTAQIGKLQAYYRRHGCPPGEVAAGSAQWPQPGPDGAVREADVPPQARVARTGARAHPGGRAQERLSLIRILARPRSKQFHKNIIRGDGAA